MATNPIPQFPAGFLWGVSTSAHQIEGAADQREPSVWDAFTAEEGRVKDGSDAAVACDHFHRYPEDVALLRELGVDAYRFSVSWPRVNAPGGLDFYDRLVDPLPLGPAAVAPGGGRLAEPGHRRAVRRVRRRRRRPPR
jgi:beta-glucosidase